MHQLQAGRSQGGVGGRGDCALLAQSFLVAGYHVFGLHPFLIGSGGAARCACGRQSCTSPGKHPLTSSWQHTPLWSEEQFDAMCNAGQFASGYGILCRELLVIDVDARNNGLASYAGLLEAVPEIAGAGLIVATGSGGGSRHLYFRAPPGVALRGQLPDYPGLDFKSTGFLVAPGSRHVSGAVYTISVGGPDDIDEAPAALVELLRRPDTHRADYNGRQIDVQHSELVSLLTHVANPDLPYDEWLRVGMALHHTTAGTGFALWDEWSRSSSKHNPTEMPARWQSFGRSANPVTFGTLVHLATLGGWVRPVTFEDVPGADLIGVAVGAPTRSRQSDCGGVDLSGLDLTSPPGFVGELAAWIEAQGRRPRRHLAVAAALTALGNVAGLRYTDDLDGVTTNLLAFCVAGSRTGKEAILQAVTEIHRAAGIASATHGAIKSEQEIVRNLTRHQAALYLVDEVGIFLQKIKNAQKRGGAAYLDGVIGMLMSAYSKATGYLLITGDLREDLRAAITREIAGLHGQLDRCESPRDVLDERVAGLERALSGLDNGIERPFLSLLGFTTPVTFEDLVDLQSATNGFIGRALLFTEPDTAPRSKPDWTPTPLPTRLALSLADIYGGGYVSAHRGRVEHYADRTKIPTEQNAAKTLRLALHWFEDQAVANKSTSGLEALYLGAYELVSKISLILAVPGGLRTTEHVRWAFALVRRDVEAKCRLVTANEDQTAAPKNALHARLLTLLADEGETLGVICNRLQRKFNRADIKTALDQLVKSGVALEVAIEPGQRQRPATRYQLAD